MSKAYSNKALPPGTILREWRLENVLGVGGFGIVYKGRGIYFDELVAIKEYFPSSISERDEDATVVPIDSDAEEVHALGLKKFVEEAKLLWNLSTPTRHPNIVSVRSLFEIHGTAYMVMDFEDGVSLSKLLKEVSPTSAAKYVRFETLLDPDRMPGQKGSTFPWPYQEGLRLDEAMNDLTILATGMYGGPLPAQDGGGIRLVVPWKYGFKSIKAIVKIDLVDTQPTSLWMNAAPDEYGFYANVNPDVPHPRWSQSTERRIGELSRRKTLPFNGYAEQVAHLYDGMDLKANF